MSPDDPCVARTRRGGIASRRSKEITDDVLSRLSREGVKPVSHLPMSVKRGANVRFFLWVSCLLIRVAGRGLQRRGGELCMSTAFISWTNMGTDFQAFLCSHGNCLSFWKCNVSCLWLKLKSIRINAHLEKNTWQTNIAVILGFVTKSDMQKNTGTKRSLAVSNRKLLM